MISTLRPRKLLRMLRASEERRIRGNQIAVVYAKSHLSLGCSGEMEFKQEFRFFFLSLPRR